MRVDESIPKGRSVIRECRIGDFLIGEVGCALINDVDPEVILEKEKSVKLERTDPLYEYFIKVMADGRRRFGTGNEIE